MNCNRLFNMMNTRLGPHAYFQLSQENDHRPEKAWSIYKGGFGDAFESALNKYNMSLSFYRDSVEQNKFYLF